MNRGSKGKTVYRKKYTPYPWKLDHVALRFEIGDAFTRVSSKLQISRNELATPAPDIELDGEDMTLVSISIDGQALEESRFTTNRDKLVIHDAPDKCTLEMEVEIKPHENTALVGLYPSGDFLLTQCEAEGFRRITYFPDRPDVMSCFEVTLVADAKRYPVLLSNGNPVESGELEW